MLKVCFVTPSSQEKLQFSYCQGLSTKPFIGETIGQQLDKTVEKFPNHEAYVFCEDNHRATFAEFQEEVSISPKVPHNIAGLGLILEDQ